MELELLEPIEGATRVALSGRLDTEGVDRVEARFNAATASDRQHAIVDLSEVTFIASMGIRMLVTAAKTLSRDRARIVLLSPQEIVEEYVAEAIEIFRE